MNFQIRQVGFNQAIVLYFFNVLVIDRIFFSKYLCAPFSCQSFDTVTFYSSRCMRVVKKRENNKIIIEHLYCEDYHEKNLE